MAIPLTVAWLLAQVNIPKLGITAYEAYSAYNTGKEIYSYIRGDGDMTMTNAGTSILQPGGGVPEPPAALVAKAWKTKAFATTPPAVGEYWVYFWRLTDGRMVSWNERKNEAKVWRPKKHIVLSSNPRMSQIRKLERTYHKTIKTMARKSDDLVLKSQVDNLRKKIAVMESRKRK